MGIESWSHVRWEVCIRIRLGEHLAFANTPADPKIAAGRRSGGRMQQAVLVWPLEGPKAIEATFACAQR